MILPTVRRAHAEFPRPIKHSWYVQAFQQAVIEAGDSLEERLTEMAFDGNVTAAIFLLKGLKPQKFREPIEQTNLLDIDVGQLSDQQLEALADRLIRSAVGNDPALVAQTRRQLEAKVRVIEGEAEIPLRASSNREARAVRYRTALRLGHHQEFAEASHVSSGMRGLESI
jgi:hypothetical protein